MRTSLKYTFLAAVFVVGFIAFLVIAMNSSSGIESESHVARVDWLPPTASDITYARRTGFGRLLTYECSVPEPDFHVLAQKKGWPVQEATNVSVSGLRLTLKLPDLTNAAGESAYAIERAFLFERRQPNGGGTTVIYDRQRNRLFYSESQR